MLPEYVDPFEIDGTPQEAAAAHARQTAKLAMFYVTALRDLETLVRNAKMQDAVEIDDDLDPHTFWEGSPEFKVTTALTAAGERHVRFLAKLATGVTSSERYAAHTEQQPTPDAAESSIE